MLAKACAEISSNHVTNMLNRAAIDIIVCGAIQRVEQGKVDDAILLETENFAVETIRAHN
jgi:hypothetical protein